MSEIMEWLSGLSDESKEDLIVVVLTIIITAILTHFIPKVIWPPIAKILTMFKDHLYNYFVGWSIFNKFGVRTYKSKFRIKFEKLTTPWANQQLFLRDLFIPIKVQTDYHIPHIVPGYSDPNKIIDMRSAVRLYQRLMIVGEPGGGKSTALKNIGLTAIDGNLFPKSDILPIFIELKDYAATQLDLKSYIAQVFHNFGFPNANAYIEKLLSNGSAILLLDALDEVNEENFERILEQIRHVCDLYSNNRIVITCRIAAYDRQLDDVIDETISLSHFNDIQINAFLQRWRYPVEKSSVALMNILRQRPKILGICRNPLMLTIVTALYVETDMELPRNRAEFYNTCIMAVLTRWDQSRGVIRRHNQFSANEKIKVLQGLAFYLHNSPLSTGDIEYPELVDKITELLPKVGRPPELAEKMIAEIVQNSGLILYVGPSSLRFAHRTFQEYFVAREINAQHDIDILIDKFIGDSIHWREVLLLFSGLSAKGGNLIAGLKHVDILMAASCIAESEAIDANLANAVLDQLLDLLQHGNDQKGALQAISLLATDQTRYWSKKAFEQLVHFLEMPISTDQRRTVIAALANVMTPASAQILTGELQRLESRDIAKAALIELGQVSLPTIEKLLETSDNKQVQEICIEICSQIAVPEVVNILLPRLTVDDPRICALSAWALSKLIQVPEIEQALTISKFVYVTYTTTLSIGVGELITWVWPGAPNELILTQTREEGNIQDIIALLINSLKPELVSEFISKYGILNRPDIRLAIPLSIQMYSSFLEGHISREAFKECVGVLLIGDNMAWSHNTKTLFSLKRNYMGLISSSPQITIVTRQHAEPDYDLDYIFSHSVQELKKAWINYHSGPKTHKSPFNGSRQIARLLSGCIVLLSLAGMWNVLTSQGLASFFGIAATLTLATTGGLIGFWKARIDQSYLRTITMILSAGLVYIDNIIERNWVNSRELLTLTISTIIVIPWMIFAIIGFLKIANITTSYVIAILLVVLSNLLFKLDKEVSQAEDLWWPIMKKNAAKPGLDSIVSQFHPAWVLKDDQTQWAITDAS